MHIFIHIHIFLFVNLFVLFICLHPLRTGTARPSRRFWTGFALGPSGLRLHPTGALAKGEPLGYEQPTWDHHWELVISNNE